MVKNILSKAETKWITGLRDKKNRDQSGVYIVEGFKMVDELVRDKIIGIAKIFGLKELLKNLGLQNAGHFELIEVNAADMQRISGLKNPSGILAVVSIPDLPAPEFRKGNWLLALDDIQDPGNVGTIIRLADWFGINTILASEGTADCYNPKTVQAAMGSVFRVNVHNKNWQALIPGCGLPVYSADMDGENALDAAGKIEPGILVIGNEGHGIGEFWRPYISRRLTIPRKGKAESLNAGVATGILLSHLV